MIKKISHHPFFIRLLHWEYWPFHAVYIFIYPIFIWYCIKARSFFFYSAANPTIENGGFLMESKKKIHDLIPAVYQPYTLHCEPGIGVKKILQEMQRNKFSYPVIIKPDIGAKGRGVIKANTDEELQIAIQKFPFAFIVQPFVPYKKEIGLFYVRCPNKVNGRITGIVEKQFVKVMGNGKNNVKELLLQQKRYVLQMKALQKLCADKMDIVLAQNEELILLPFGNHARGSLFLDASHWIDEELVQSLNNICSQINGFYYGRMDIKYESLELLKQGTNFSIIELNGAGSEPTHIYDPKHSIFFAWKEIIRHWKILYEISMLNKKNGCRFMTFKEGKQMFNSSATYNKQLALI